MKPNASIFVVLALFIAACQPRESSRASDDVVGTDNLAAEIARGEYLVTAIGCNDCHTPKIFGPQEMSLDYDLLLSGHPASEDLASYDTLTTGSWVLMSPSLTAYVGPWGTSFASNLTPDGTGIGTWTEAQFAKAIREGKAKGLDGARPLLPPMPWQNLVNLSDEDVHDIFTYLKSLKPVRNIVPNPLPSMAVK